MLSAGVYIKFNHNAVVNSAAAIKAHADALIISHGKYKGLRMVSDLTDSQMVVMLKAMITSMNKHCVSYDTYQAGAKALMQAGGPSLHELGYADESLVEYHKTLYEAKVSGASKKALYELAESIMGKPVLPYTVASLQVIKLLVDMRQVVHLKTGYLKEIEPGSYVESRHDHYQVAVGSDLESCIAFDPNNHGVLLSASPFSDYDENGVNADGESIYL